MLENFGFGTVDWQHLSASLGSIYSLKNLVLAVMRGFGLIRDIDPNHRPGTFLKPPSIWVVNQASHWRHHFDNCNANFCGVFSFLDKLLGTALSLKDKKVAVTGASGSLGQALLHHLNQVGAKVISVTNIEQQITCFEGDKSPPIKTIIWKVGQEEELVEALKAEEVDILIINHEIDLHEQYTKEVIIQSFEVNTFFPYRLLELFLKTIHTNEDIATKEVWVNISKMKFRSVYTPFYSLSKQILEDLVTLQRLNAPCVIRKIILEPLNSQLDYEEIRSASWAAKCIVNLAQRDIRNIIVGYNPFRFALIFLSHLDYLKLYRIL